MTSPESIVVVGGGLAGATAAFTLRERGFRGTIALVAEERVAPYERPPLSKGYLRGESPLDEALVRPVAAYAEADIDLLLGRRAVGIDVMRRSVALDGGETLPWGALLLATGSAPRPLDVPGADLAGVHYLRDAADADALREAAAAAASIVVIGGGWIGTEVAASLRQLGGSVTLIGSTDRPLERVLGPEVGEVYRQLHLEHGVRLVRGRVAKIEGDDAVSGVRLLDGTVLAADLVVAGVGATPRIGLAVEAGLEMADGGVAVDEYLESSAAGIYAAGDIAAAWHPVLERRVRVEHWDNAKRQGRAAAANILGAKEPYKRTPYFYSDQFDLGMEYRGDAREWDEVVLRGDLGAREFDAFWLRDGRILAAMNANRWDDGKALSALVARGARIDPSRLADTNIPLADLAPAGAAPVA